MVHVEDPNMGFDFNNNGLGLQKVPSLKYYLPTVNISAFKKRTAVARSHAIGDIGGVDHNAEGKVAVPNPKSVV